MKRSFLRLTETQFFFLQNKRQKFAKRLVFIWEMGTFLFALFPVVATKWFEPRSELSFLGPKARFLAQKSFFCHRTANFINGPFLVLGKMVHIQPLDQLFDFSFPSYARFRKKKLANTPKSFHPPHCGSADKQGDKRAAQRRHSQDPHSIYTQRPYPSLLILWLCLLSI